eukprot:3135681-Rhodomonas_salina.1
MTSHEILGVLKAEYKRQGGQEVVGEWWEGGPTQVKIMVDLGMFQGCDFTKVKFTDLQREDYG